MEAKVRVLSDPARRLTKAFAESKTKLAATLVVATLLQTRAPTGKRGGPAAGLLLSSPTMFQVMGVTVSAASAASGARRAQTSRTRTERFRRIAAGSFSCRVARPIAAC